MKHAEKKEIICPFCEEGVLQTVACRKCKKESLRCDECESVYRDAASLTEEAGPGCAHCGAPLP